MEIKIPRTTYETIDIPKAQVLEITRKKLKSLLPSDGEYISEKSGDDTKWLCRTDNNYHGSPDTIYIRKATELDLAICLVLEVLANSKL